MSDDLVAKLNRLAEAKDWGTGYGVELTLREAATEIERLRAALRECAADYISPPCTIPQAAVYVGKEFNRRMHIAAEALENT